MLTMITVWLRNSISAVFFTALFFVFPTILPASGEASSEVLFLDFYAKIIRAVDAGKLDKTVGHKARALNSELQKKINYLDTRLDTLKADFMKQDSSNKDMLLDDLISSGAERERIYLYYYQKLEQLDGINKQELGRVPSSSSGLTVSKKTENGAELEEHSTSSQNQTVKFEIVPEDISSGNFE